MLNDEKITSTVGKTFIVVLGAFLLAVVLGACAALDPISQDDPQGYAGIVHARIDCDIKGATENRPGQKICDAVLFSGREQAKVSLEFDPDTGKVIYSAEGVSAFQGQVARNQLGEVIAKAAADAGTQIAPNAIKAIVDAIIK